jgi:DNA repair exonuclease SbcCD ATPase subunit
MFVATIAGTTALQSVLKNKPSLIFGDAWFRECEGVHLAKNAKDVIKFLDNKIYEKSVEKEKVDNFFNNLNLNSFEASKTGISLSNIDHEIQDASSIIIKRINEIENNSKQLISINQASGFQHFVISLALRMSLFVNKQETMCNQLFIDEGFINFDRENLSIVPTFIKSLLSYFNNIVIVSHIDLIQDNIDEIAEIKYNKINSVSSMEYGNYKKVIKKRNKK